MDHQAFATALQEIRSDRSHGASELARRCLELLVQSADTAPAQDGSELLSILTQRCDAMIAARPSMAPIQNLLREWQVGLTQQGSSDLKALRSSAAEMARKGIQRSKQALAQVAEQAAGFIGQGKCIITHSLSSTLLAVFAGLRDMHVSAIATESRPLNEGHILISQLSQWGIPTQLITDAQLGLFVPRADLALLGADCLLPDGSVVNKAGSYLLALAAQDAGVPLYICCENFKLRAAGMGEPKLEEMEVGELGAPTLSGVEVRNIYFDITPARLIDAWINEGGVHQDFPPGRVQDE